MKRKKIIEKNLEQTILDVAEKLFMEKGYAMTSTIEIAKSVGCNQALVHYYFRTKERLFEAVFEKKIKLFVLNLLKIEEENRSFEEKLRRKIGSHFEIFQANPKLPFLLFNELITNPKRLTTLIHKLEELPKTAIKKFQKELNQEIKKGNIRKVTLLDLWITLISLNVTLFLSSPI